MFQKFKERLLNDINKLYSAPSTASRKSFPDQSNAPMTFGDRFPLKDRLASALILLNLPVTAWSR